MGKEAPRVGSASASEPEGGGPGPAGVAPEQQFVHLHLHTEYSLLDGGNRLDKLVARVKELGMTAVAVTDHGNLHGAVAFYEKAKEAGIKPILGVEAYVAPGDRKSREPTGVADGGFHLVLLAETDEGWGNLLSLCSEAYLTGFYYKPRMDRALLEARSAGLIAINGHLGSELAHHLVEYEKTRHEQHWARALEVAAWHGRVFGPGPTGPRFYVELQHHIREQNAINPHLIRLAREVGAPLVATNDAHFLREEDHDAHDTLICISMGKNKGDADRLHYPRELFVKSPGAMRSAFEAYGPAGREACDHAVRIAERCNVNLPIGANHAPAVRATLPDERELPRHDDPAFAGDLSAWYRAYCGKFELSPYRSGEPGAAGDAAARDGDRALRLLAEAGFVWRYGAQSLAQRHALAEGTPAGESARAKLDGPDRAMFDQWARLNRELKILSDKGISAYFLIVWDFVNWGRQRGIPALARGSGVGTMVGYVLGLSNACPVRYGLLFERFTDPDRSEFPDIDIDLCQDGRGDVIDYVRRKYGHVAQIITFGTLKARAAIRDVARVLGVSLPVADRIAKLIPETLNITLDQAIAAEPELRSLVEGQASALAKVNKDLAPEQQIDRERVAQLVAHARTIEGQARHASVHAAGVIVATRPLHEIVPLYKQTGAGEHEVVTQWDGPTCEKMGLLKMDFLGLRTLSVVERCRALIREGLDEGAVWAAVGRGPGDGGAHPLDLDRLGFDDPRVFELFQRGDTTGVFQFESGGMRRLLVEMKPDRLEDLIAANALFRPGPMDLIPDYNRRKHGQDAVPRVHEIVDRHTAETYGVMVYQEQVMQIVHELGDIPLRAAYTLIKAISKKKAKTIDQYRPKFIDGAQRKGLSKAQADELFELILKFAGYGFNKSHSTGYAIVAYQTAYLKTYFPNQYMAAFLSFESKAAKVSEWLPYLEDCRRTRFVGGKVGVEVRPPDINRSRADFSVVFEPGEPRDARHGHVRFGLSAIKGVGEKAIETIVRERDAGPQGAGGAGGAYASLFEFCERVLAGGGAGPGVINKAMLDALVRCGAFDGVHGRDKRAAMVASIDAAMSAGQKAALDKAAGQGALFGLGGGASPSQPSPPTPLARATPWTEAQTLAHEKDALGFYVSSHPLDSWRAWSEVFATCPTIGLRGLAQDARVVLAALVQSVRTLVVKQGRSAGQKMAIATLEDTHGAAEAVLFTDAYRDYAHLLESDGPKFVMGRLDHSRGDPQVIVEKIVPIEGVPLQGGRLTVTLRGERLNGEGPAAVERLRSLLLEHAAPGPGAGGPGGPGGKARERRDELAESGPPAVAFDLVIDTGDAFVTLRPAPAQPRVRLDPALTGAVASLLGEGSAKLVGGMSVEVAKNGRWNGPRRGGGDE